MPESMSVAEKMALRLGLPREAVLSLPHISMVGNRRVEVVGHKGILAFSPLRVDIATQEGTLGVKGQELVIESIGMESVLISGYVSAVVFGAGDEDE